MTFPFLINIIAVGLLWYVIPLLQSFLREIRLESHLDVKATLCNLMLPLLISGIKTMLILFIRMTYPIAMTKLMLLALILLKKLWSLHKWRDIYKSKNQVLEPVLLFWSCGLSATMNAVATRLDAKSSRSDFFIVVVIRYYLVCSILVLL